MKRLDRFALKMIGGLTDKEIAYFERAAARRRNKKAKKK